MQVILLKEDGHEEALFGMSLSYYDHEQMPFPMGTKEVEARNPPLFVRRVGATFNATNAFWNNDKYKRAQDRAAKLAFKGQGHSKFLESIVVWVYIQASRDFWQEFDTYRVGMTKQSSSTMHTLDKRNVTLDDFEIDTLPETVHAFNKALDLYKTPGNDRYKDISFLKKNLPEGWLQERVICTNYKVLQHIYLQRKNHRLRQWKQYIEQLTAQLEYPEYIREETCPKD